MQSILQEIPITLPPIGEKPFIISHDSGAECSLEHWIEVRMLVEKAYLSAVTTEDEVISWT